MIYISEKSLSRQIELLTHVAGTQEMLICAWLYPESTATAIAGFPTAFTCSNLEPITTYEDSVSVVHTQLAPASAANISSYKAAESELIAHCDSLALHREGESSWFAATIGHEGMCLVKEQSLLPSLIAAGYAASAEPPSWW
jgi:hypothetical protein